MSRPPVRFHESMSGPRELAWGADCAVCRAESTQQCPGCCEAVCDECMVECAHCGGEPICLSCAVKRGYAEIDGTHFCEECAGAMEPELETVRR